MILLLSFFIFYFSIAHSASDTFTVQTLVGSDAIPPTVPANLVATPIAPSQIDLSWDASTDDVLMGGYHVWRDDVQIATTTSTMYSDTGLAESTLYTYYVIAYDASMNTSASSTPAAATTQTSPPPTPTSTESGTTYGSRLRPLKDEIISLTIVPEKDAVTIRYETKGYVRSIIKWGRTPSYELGSLAEKAFTTRHETRIIGLTPGTQYHLSLEGKNRVGIEGVMHEGTFTTLPPDDVFPPGNVLDFAAVRDGDDVVLSWNNPLDSDFAKVRIVRSDRFYPSDIADGWVAYEGSGESARDNGAARSAARLYYTAFAYDERGNISSGAVVMIRLRDGVQTGTTSATGTDAVLSDANDMHLAFDDLVFEQEGMNVLVEDGVVHVDGSKQLIISLPYERVPEHLKTILTTLRDSSGKEFQFLLRINPQKTAYTTTLAPFGVSGEYVITVVVFDFKTSQIGHTAGNIVSSIRPLYRESEVTEAAGGFLRFMHTIGGSYLLWIVVVLTFAFFIRRRLRHS